MKKYKVAYTTSSRADYGIVKNYLKILNEDYDTDLSILVTGSHLEEKYGHSIDIILQDGFKIDFEVQLNLESSNNASVIHSMSVALDSFGKYFEVNKFDLLIVLGDRYEIMPVAIAAAMQRIPILHLHGGEVTYGNYDEFIRHSITKMSRYHFVSTETYRKRVIQLGEDPKKVFYLGALGAENCRHIDEKLVDTKIKKLGDHKYWVVAFHPETLTNVNIKNQVIELLSALKENSNGYSIVFIGTNADTNSDIIRNLFLDFVKTNKNMYFFENLNVESFLYMVKNGISLIGNSSAGIIEAPSLGRYTINIGDRQKGRIHGNSVIDVPCDRNMIGNAMKDILEKVDSNKQIDNVYYKENTALEYYKKTKEILGHIDLGIKKFYDI